WSARPYGNKDRLLQNLCLWRISDGSLSFLFSHQGCCWVINDIVLILRSIYRAASPHMRFRPGHSLRGGFNNRTSAVGSPLPVHDCSVRTASISTMELGPILPSGGPTFRGLQFSAGSRSPHRGTNRTLRDSISVPQLVFLPRPVIAGNAAIFSP